MAERVRNARRGSIRSRITIVAVVVVGAALVVAAAGLVLSLDRSLRAGVRTETFTRARGIALELGSGAAATLATAGDPEGEFVQVVGLSGDVVASSANVSGREALVTLAPGTSTTLNEVPLEDRPFLVAAVTATTPEGPAIVLVGRSLEDVTDAVRSLTRSLAVAIPALLVVVGALAWLLVGRALAPVESIRREVESISPQELHRRVPEPAGDDEISRLAKTMNRMLSRLERGRARERRFVSDASHELRSPVASIRQQVEVALTHPDRSDPRELAEVVLEEDLRLQRIVEDLLLLSRIDEGAPPRNPQPVDLDDLVFEEAARLRLEGMGRVDTSAVSAGRVLGEREPLARLVRNLADNAARHARGRVAFALGSEDGDVVLDVDDDGPGIPAEERERIFERFVRLDEARERDAGGSGLGLAIVAEVARLHGGAAEALDRPGGGARLRVRLPRHD